MIHIYHGDGKGKTTAAIGLLARAAGAGLRTALICFDKGGYNYAERGALAKLGVEIIATGENRIDPATNEFRFGVTEADRREAARGIHEATRIIFSGEYDLVVLDEVLNCLRLEMLPLITITKLLDQTPENLELALTGRGLPAEIAERADLISEIKKGKHYFDHGQIARPGIDF